MNWRHTWLLVGIAAALFAFIFLYERHLTTSDTVAAPMKLLTLADVDQTTALQVRRGTQMVISLERTNQQWAYVKPFNYRAATLAVDAFLETLARVVPTTYITAQEILARKQTEADFGLDTPQTVVSLQSASGSQKIQFGGRTPAQDQVYTQVIGKPGVYVVPAGILDRLPRTQHDWRDTAVFAAEPQKLDRCDIMRGDTGFSLQRDPTNQLWKLARPAHRADQVRVELLLNDIFGLRVLDFVSDDPRGDLEPFGLQPPQAEVTLGTEAALQKVQFGRSPTNDPARIYARLLNTSNVVLVSRSAMDLVSISYTELRDRRLIAFAPELIDTIEARAGEPFVLKKAGASWMAGDVAVDTAFVNEWLTNLSELQVTEFVKDIVALPSDFAPFALAPPLRQYTLSVAVTNALGPTNIVIGQVAFGTNQNIAYARRFDEASVYSIPMRDYLHLPGAVWHLREHRVWSFVTNQVVRVVVRDNGRARELVRQANGDWTLGPGSTGEINPFALEELMFRLGDLNATAWIARGEEARRHFGFSTNGYQITIELKDGDKTRPLLLEFGGMSPLRLPYACTPLDGQPWIFEFPWQIYADVQRYLDVPGSAAARPRGAPAANARPPTGQP